MRESPRKEKNKEADVPEKSSKGGGKISGMSSATFTMIKFIMGLCLLPFVYSVTVAFLAEFSGVQVQLQRFFWAGVISFLLVYLFAWEPAVIYGYGQKLLEVVFSFFQPLVKVAPPLVPIYAVIISLVFAVLLLIDQSLLKYYIFLIGFSMSLHLVFSAKSMRGKQSHPFQANYLFGFSLIYIINILVLSLLLSVIFDVFSFVHMFNGAFVTASSLIGGIFKQLFVPR